MKVHNCSDIGILFFSLFLFCQGQNVGLVKFASATSLHHFWAFVRQGIAQFLLVRLQALEQRCQRSTALEEISPERL